MANIFVNGCFDLLHEGHKIFLQTARHLGDRGWRFRGQVFTSTAAMVIPPIASTPANLNRLIVAVNSDESARRLKAAKWGENYPHENLAQRMENLRPYADRVIDFDTEEQLHDLILTARPCIICKGPDYAGKRVTGDDIAPVVILDCPEPESVKQMKIRVYGRAPKL